MLNSYPCAVGSLSSDDWEGQAVFAFGNAHVDNAIPAEKVLRIANPSGEVLANLREGFELEMLSDGLIFVLPEKADGLDMKHVLEIQKILLHAHYKYVFFPGNSHATADPVGVRKETLPDVSRIMSQLNNYPWLMSAPLVDKLAAAKINLPVMLLMPGPSIKEVLPHLKEIRKRCLIACIARTINDCVDAGVIPDIAIQLDTYHIQRAYYEKLPAMPETLLVPLSICPFYPYANKFRGVVMMDSFNMELLPNPARLRESYVSSLTACLGLAEALHAPDAFVAGANLSSEATPEEHPYWGQTDGAYPILPLTEHDYILSTRNGSMVQSRDWYIATATEADQFAEIIATTSGTRFHSTTDSTLLSEQWFPHTPIDKIMELPLIDRQHYLDTIDTVLAQRESINLMKTRLFLLKQLAEIKQVDQTYSMRGAGTTDEFLQEHVMTKAAMQMRNPKLGPKVDAIGVAARLCTKWRETLNNSRLLIQGITNAEKGKSLPLVCFPEEIQPLKKVLGRIIPGAHWELHSIATSPHPPFTEGKEIEAWLALKWLALQQIVFVSPRTMREYPYIFDFAPDENFYDLRLIFGDNT